MIEAIATALAFISIQIGTFTAFTIVIVVLLMILALCIEKIERKYFIRIRLFNSFFSAFNKKEIQRILVIFEKFSMEEKDMETQLRKMIASEKETCPHGEKYVPSETVSGLFRKYFLAKYMKKWSHTTLQQQLLANVSVLNGESPKDLRNNIEQEFDASNWLEAAREELRKFDAMTPLERAIYFSSFPGLL